MSIGIKKIPHRRASQFEFTTKYCQGDEIKEVELASHENIYIKCWKA
jgi:hypothetical protein